MPTPEPAGLDLGPEDDAMTGTNSSRDPAPSLVNVTHLTYGLHALGLALGAFGRASVVGSFLFGWPSHPPTVPATSSTSSG